MLALRHCERCQRTLNNQTIISTLQNSIQIIQTFTCPELRGHDNAIPPSAKFNTIPARDDVAPSFAPVYGHVVPTVVSTSASFPPKSMKTTDPPHQESQEVAMNRHTTAPDSIYPLCIAETVYFRRTRVITLSAGSRNYRGR